MKHRISETFCSIQGEGAHTGVLSVWVRYFGCNLRCPGFSTSVPTESEYGTTLVPSSIEEFQVSETGCDSIYSHLPQFKHLSKDFSTQELGDSLISLIPGNRWNHPVTNNPVHLCFTGGEPMLWQSQMVSLLEWFAKPAQEQKAGLLQNIQIETNGTKFLTQKFLEFFESPKHNTLKVHFNVSPKMFNVSGEKGAWNNKVILEYQRFIASRPASSVTLKVVVDGTEKSWRELAHYLAMYKEEAGVDTLPFRVYIMPVGATKEQQENSSFLKDIVERAICEGYYVSGRYHTIVWGNTTGT